MTDDFLRRHPEIAEMANDAQWKLVRAHKGRGDLTDIDIVTAGLAAVLPAILAAHEADLSRGYAETGEMQDAWASVFAPMSMHDMNCITDLILHERAAAYLAGRAAGREEAARAAEDTDVTRMEAYGAREAIIAAIRSRE